MHSYQTMSSGVLHMETNPKFISGNQYLLNLRIAKILLKLWGHVYATCRLGEGMLQLSIAYLLCKAKPQNECHVACSRSTSKRVILCLVLIKKDYIISTLEFSSYSVCVLFQWWALWLSIEAVTTYPENHSHVMAFWPTCNKLVEFSSLWMHFVDTGMVLNPLCLCFCLHTKYVQLQSNCTCQQWWESPENKYPERQKSMCDWQREINNFQIEVICIAAPFLSKRHLKVSHCGQ